MNETTCFPRKENILTKKRQNQHISLDFIGKMLFPGMGDERTKVSFIWNSRGTIKIY